MLDTIRKLADRLKTACDEEFKSYIDAVEGKTEMSVLVRHFGQESDFVAAVKLAQSERGIKSVITDDFRVDQFDNVYDEKGVFFCKWYVLSDEEKEIVKDNPFSAK